VTSPYANRLSDAAFVALLGLFGLAVALVPVPGWLRMVGFDVLLAATSGVTLYLVLKYVTGAAYPSHGTGVQPPASEPVRDGLAVGYTLLVLVWAGLLISVLGDMTIGVGSDAAVNFILKPAWLRPSRMSQHERMALGRATGMAWLVGAIIDFVTTVTK
jgi:hypothetical protein